MGGKKTGKSKTKKKLFKRKKHDKISYSSSTKVGVNAEMGAHPLKDHWRTKLRYVQTNAYTTGAAGIMGTQQVYSLNSLYDPDQTSTGHQPYLFDQYAGLYAKYRVDAVKVNMLWSTVGNANADMMTAYCLQPSQGGISLTGLGIDRCAEIQSVTTGLVSPSGNTRTMEQSFYIPLHKIEGISKKKYQDEDAYSALCTADPASQCQLSVDVGSPSGVAGEACICQVTLDYYCTFFERKVQAQS